MKGRVCLALALQSVLLEARRAPAAPYTAPPPHWTPIWNLTESTVIQPGGGEASKNCQESTGYFMPAHPWGLVSLDSSILPCRLGAHADPDFSHPHHGNTTSCEAASREDCRRIKAAGRATRCFIYHNFELALEWLESQRAVMYDPAKRDLFLQYPNGTLYSHGSYPDGIGMMLFWNYSNPAAADYVVDSILSTVNNSDVDGTFTDDSAYGFPEHGYIIAELDLAAGGQLDRLNRDMNATYVRLVQALIAANKSSWQSLSEGRGSGSMTRDPVQLANDTAKCIGYMRYQCQPALQQRPWLMQGPCGESEKNGQPHCNHVNQSVAAFLIARPPVAFIGDGWESDDATWHDVYLLQPGEPTGLCAETRPGVFTRGWSNGVAALDCNTFTASLPFPSL